MVHLLVIHDQGSSRSKCIRESKALLFGNPHSFVQSRDIFEKSPIEGSLVHEFAHFIIENGTVGTFSFFFFILVSR